MFNSTYEAIHYALRSDEAYKYSVTKNDWFNMQIVLRAWGYEFTETAAKSQIQFARAA